MADVPAVAEAVEAATIRPDLIDAACRAWYPGNRPPADWLVAEVADDLARLLPLLVLADLPAAARGEVSRLETENAELRAEIERLRPTLERVAKDAGAHRC